MNNLALVDRELDQLAAEKLNSSKQTIFQWSDFWHKAYLFRPLMVTIFVQMSQQLSGINAVNKFLKRLEKTFFKVVFYSTSIFENAGFSSSMAVYGTIAIGIVQIIMTIICVLIVDRVGRRILLLIGMMGMCVSAFGLSAFSIISNKVTELFSSFSIVCNEIFNFG